MSERMEDDEGRPLWEIPEWMSTEHKLHADWDGNNIPLLGYVCLMEDESYRRIATTTLMRWGLFVSTIWLGTDMSFGHGGRPVLFETMVFMTDSELEEPGSSEYLDMQFRHNTREEALVEHFLIVEGIMRGKDAEEIWEILLTSDLTGAKP